MPSKKQRRVFHWWSDKTLGVYDGIICDGAVRSGKTMCMTFSFLLWSMTGFKDAKFAICGKTIGSVRRNILDTLRDICQWFGFGFNEKVTQNYIDITNGNQTNRFYIFGGKDEGSAALIQGMTLSGVFFDEVALMPRSFVEQAVARCSEERSRLWFNCNPENSSHWFKREWIDRSDQKRLLHMHFTLDDNPTLSRRIKERYRRLYSGVFFDRFILGKWCDLTGLVYPQFSKKSHVVKRLPKRFSRYIVSCDYGTVNPSSFGLWGLHSGVWYRLAEYYFDSRREGYQRTDEEHYSELVKLCAGREIERVVCDPSAASFITCIRRHGELNVVTAKNEVVSGIRRVADMLSCGTLKISAECTDCLREFELYRWDESSSEDKPIKENDHAMDDLRYFVNEIYESDDELFVMSLER